MPIEFATPEKAEGGVNATMSQVMNLVHDIILRRDVSHLASMRLASFMMLNADLMYPSVNPTLLQASLKTYKPYGRQRHNKPKQLAVSKIEPLIWTDS